MSRRIYTAAVLIVLLFLSSFLTGCGRKETPDTAVMPETAAQNQAEAPAGDADQREPGSSTAQPGQSARRQSNNPPETAGGSNPRTQTGRGGPGGMMGDAYASCLELTPDQLQEQLKSGKRISDIVSEQGMTMDQFNQKVLAHEKDRVAQEVKDGKITQEQADEMIQSMERRMAGAGAGARGAGQ